MPPITNSIGARLHRIIESIRNLWSRGRGAGVAHQGEHPMALVGIAATLILPERPHWVRVSLHDNPGILLSGTETLVPDSFASATESEAKLWLHRLVAGEAARRETMFLEPRRAPSTEEWKRSADTYLHRFRGIPHPSAMAREVLFERLVRDVRLRFYFMARRLRKAHAHLEEFGFLANRELMELWGAYRLSDERCQDEGRLVEDDIMPEHLKEAQVTR